MAKRSNLTDLTIKVAPDTTLKMKWKGTSGVDNWLASMDRFDRAASDMSPAFRSFGTYMRRSIDRRFASEGAPDYWAPLARTTIAERIRLGFGAGPVLKRTGKLKNGFEFDSKIKYFRVRNTVDYFPHHQYGAPRANIPKRIMVRLDEQDRTEFARIYRRHLGV